MNPTMNYKGYLGSVEFSEESDLFYGKVLGIRGLLSYEGKDMEDLATDFHDTVDEYLAYCLVNGIVPEPISK